MYMGIVTKSKTLGFKNKTNYTHYTSVVKFHGVRVTCVGREERLGENDFWSLHIFLSIQSRDI